MSSPRTLNSVFKFHSMRETGVVFECLADTTPTECERFLEHLEFPTDWKRFGDKVLFWKTSTVDESDDDACSHGSDEHCDK